MSQIHYAAQAIPGLRQQPRHRPRLRQRSFLWLPVAIFLAAVIGAGSWVTYILWPRWPASDYAVDAPTLPIIINGGYFNIPPAAIRNKVQRKPGVQERIDLVFLWPSLTPPDPAIKSDPVASPLEIDRVFLTLAGFGNTLPLMDRFNTIYPRYLAADTGTEPGGLTLRAFRDDTAYRGEDLVYDAGQPSRFIARCTRDNADTGRIGMCLYEKRIGQTDLTARFPRAWLAEPQALMDRLEMLINQLGGARKA